MILRIVCDSKVTSPDDQFWPPDSIPSLFLNVPLCLTSPLITFIFSRLFPEGSQGLGNVPCIEPCMIHLRMKAFTVDDQTAHLLPGRRLKAEI
jgi:hypothetical protein